MLFLTPLVLDEQEIRTVRLTLTREPDGFGFRISSRLPATGDRVAGQGIDRVADQGTIDGVADQGLGHVADPAAAGQRDETAWQVHARGRVRAADVAVAPAPLDLEELRRRCSVREIVPDGPLMSAGEGPIFWGPRWQSLRKVEVGDGEWLATLELPEEFAGDLSRFAVHPALLDVATGLVGFFEEGTHVPLSYRRVTLLRPLPARFHSWFRKVSEGGAGKEAVAVDVTLCDEGGEPLVQIERFVLKRIDAAAAFSRPAAAAAPPALGAAAAAGTGTEAEAPATPAAPAFPGLAGASGVGAEGILSREGVEVLRRVLARGRWLPQVAASAKDLAALFAQVRELGQAGMDRFGGAARGGLAGGAGAARPSHPRPQLSTPYTAPRNDVESRLAAIFQAALGIEEVGVHDNFFDLGGDSMVGIQVVARANEMQLQLSPDQLFEHQTIAELAALLPAGEGDLPVRAEPPPATPVQAEAGAGPAAAGGDSAPGAAERPAPEDAFADSGVSAADLEKVLSKLAGAG